VCSIGKSGGPHIGRSHCSVRRLLVTASVVPSSPILVTLMRDVLRSSETPVLTRATGRIIPENGILHSERREYLKSYIWNKKLYSTFWTMNHNLGWNTDTCTVNEAINRSKLVAYIARSSIQCSILGITRGKCWWYPRPNQDKFVRFEVFTAVTMKNGVFWDVTTCGSCKKWRFGGT
jgi:hypothetical protein